MLQQSLSREGSRFIPRILQVVLILFSPSLDPIETHLVCRLLSVAGLSTAQHGRVALEPFLLLGALLFPRLGHCQKHRQVDALLTSLFITENVP